jgi:hypothetical protein
MSKTYLDDLDTCKKEIAKLEDSMYHEMEWNQKQLQIAKAKEEELRKALVEEKEKESELKGALQRCKGNKQNSKPKPKLKL